MGKLFLSRSRKIAPFWLWGIGAGLLGCSSDYFVRLPGPPPEAEGSGGSISVAGKGSGVSIPPSKGGGGKSFAPSMDERPVVTPAHQPPPLSGGTLLGLRAGGRMVVADPDRDRLSFVDVENFWVEATLDLGAGAEPGRLVEGNGEVHALLRGTGEVVTVSLTSHAVVSRRAVCKAPRGLVFDQEQGTLIVACLEGRLVELPASEGAILRQVETEVDLRDLVLSNGRLLATRFRSAEVLEFDAEFAVTQRFTLGKNGEFTPSVAWRAIAGPDGSLIVSHQRGTTAKLSLADDPVGVGGSDGEPASGGGGAAGPGESGYGSLDPCVGIVESAVSVLSADGSLKTSSRIAGSVLPVNIAFGPAGVVAIANAGLNEFGNVVSNSIQVFSTTGLEQQPNGNCTFPDLFEDSSTPAVGATFDAKSGLLVVQTRDPATIRIYDDSFFGFEEVALGGVSVIETGHEIFHRDSGGGIACASCHPEGTDDGRVWNFNSLGLRRTQPLDVRLEGSAPFHWDGEFENIGSLVGDVLVSRMGGTPQSAPRVAALENFLYRLRPRPGIRAADDTAALRGKELFGSERTGCTECHQGATFSNFEMANIGRGSAMQVPSLLGVSTRLPLMHDGCAATLLDRFDPDCGGSRHGSFEDLPETDVNDLVAYLETL